MGLNLEYLNGMTPEEFRGRFGYLPGGEYDGGRIGKTANGVDGDHIVYRDQDITTTYHTMWYRQQIS